MVVSVPNNTTGPGVGVYVHGRGDLEPDADKELQLRPDSIISLGSAESIVYQPCTATLPPNSVAAKDGAVPKVEHVEAGQQTDRFWPLISRLVRDHLPRLRCCDVPQDDVSQGSHEVEMQGFNEIELHDDGTDEVDVRGSNVPSTSSSKPQLSSCGNGPVMTVDSTTTSVENEVARIRASLGDVVKRLVVRNSPLDSAMKILLEPLITENVTSLIFLNCDISLRTLCSIVVGLKQLENLSLETTERYPGFIMGEDYANSRNNPPFYDSLSNEVATKAKQLRFLQIRLPQIWQCSVACNGIGAVLQGSTLVDLHIDASLKNVISPLITSDIVRFEDERTWRDLVTLNIRDVLEQHSTSLKHLSINCADNFPLEYMQLENSLGKSKEELFKWCFVATCGILKPLASDRDRDTEQNGNRSSLTLPALVNMHFDLPLIPVPMIREDAFRMPLNTLAEFLARNNGAHVITLNGLRPVSGMENWIRNSFVTIPKFRMAIGCTYTSTSLGNNLPTYDDELSSLGIEIVADDLRRRVIDIIDPTGAESVPQPWRFSGMKIFHLVNQLPSLISYDMDRIAVKFSKLTKLVLEDNALPDSVRNGAAGADAEGATTRSLSDDDMQTIFKTLICLEYLHLDCSMVNVTDRGLTGISDSFWCRLTQKTKMYSFWFLCNLKYIYMRGLGTQVTDKSAIYAFSEDYSLMKLKELHVYAPGFTNHGREKIRRAYASRSDFILEV